MCTKYFFFCYFSGEEVGGGSGSVDEMVTFEGDAHRHTKETDAEIKPAENEIQRFQMQDNLHHGRHKNRKAQRRLKKLLAREKLRRTNMKETTDEIENNTIEDMDNINLPKNDSVNGDNGNDTGTAKPENDSENQDTKTDLTDAIRADTIEDKVRTDTNTNKEEKNSDLDEVLSPSLQEELKEEDLQYNSEKSDRNLSSQGYDYGSGEVY